MPRRYLLGRIAQAALVLWAAFTASFILLQLLPGDAVLIKFLNPELGLGPQEIADIRAAYGADQPVWQQYLHTLAQFLTGHFGYSLQAGVPVSQGLATSLPPTLRLAALGFSTAALLAIALAAAASLAPLAWLGMVRDARRPSATRRPSGAGYPCLAWSPRAGPQSPVVRFC